MENELRTAFKNTVLILMLDFLALPAAVILYLFHGFHIVHVVLGVGYLYGLVLVLDTALIFRKNLQLKQKQTEYPYDPEEGFCCKGEYDGTGCECGQSLKPEMRQAMDEVFDLKK